jgi:ketosteroid isomerase-like protein
MSRYEVHIDEFAVEDRRIGATVAFMRYRTAGRFVPRAGGEPVPMNHKYLETYAKDAGGSWRIVTHMWSSNDSRPSVFA